MPSREEAGHSVCGRGRQEAELIAQEARPAFRAFLGRPTPGCGSACSTTEGSLTVAGAVRKPSAWVLPSGSTVRPLRRLDLQRRRLLGRGWPPLYALPPLLHRPTDGDALDALVLEHLDAPSAGSKRMLDGRDVAGCDDGVAEAITDEEPEVGLGRRRLGPDEGERALVEPEDLLRGGVGEAVSELGERECAMVVCAPSGGR